MGALGRMGASPHDPGPRKSGISRMSPVLATPLSAAKALPWVVEAGTQGSGVALC